MSRDKQTARYASCQWCGGPIPDGLRSHARYCKAACRVLASRARRQAATAGESINAGTLAGHPIPHRRDA